MLRLFIAVTLPEDALRACEDEAERARRALGPHASALRFAGPDGRHVTLKFLGATPDGLVSELEAALKRAAASRAPFPAALEGLVAFPDTKRPRVVGVGIREGAPELTALAAAVERELLPLGFPAEKRAFRPHVTLARVKDPGAAARAGARLERLEARPIARFAVTAVVLMKSELAPSGSRYTPLARVSLGEVA